MTRYLALTLLFGCSDYEVKGREEDPAPFDTGAPGVPDLVVTPDLVAETAVCGAREVPVTLRNRGDEPLEIQGLALTGTAAAQLPETPFTLAAGADRSFAIDVSPGEATLTVTSDDPDDPVVTVPISAAADLAPTISILSPAASDVVDVGAALDLSVRVADDADAPGALAVAWISDIDGAVASPVADATGLATSAWDAGARSAGPHTLTAVVTDTCGNTAVETRAVCQQAGYDEESLDLSTWQFEGVANWDSTNAWLELTGPGTSAVGTAFQTSAAVTGDAVSIEARFYIGGGTGADGMALTALDVDRMTGFLGSAGGCLGYGFGGGCNPAWPALPGWTIELDTYTNGEWDPTSEDHVAFMFDGAVERIEAWAALPELEDTGWHTLEVEVTAPHVRVVIDGVAYIDQDIAGYYGFPAYVGFSAATGSLTNYHLIDGLLVTEYACPVE